MPFLAEPVDHVGEGLFVGTTDGLSGRGTDRGIHPHIERLVAAEAEASCRIELQRRDPQIRKNSVHFTNPVRIEYRRDPPVVRVHEIDLPGRAAGKPLARNSHSRGIAIEPNQPCRTRLEYRCRMAAQANGAVDKHAPS